MPCTNFTLMHKHMPPCHLLTSSHLHTSRTLLPPSDTTALLSPGLAKPTLSKKQRKAAAAAAAAGGGASGTQGKVLEHPANIAAGARGGAGASVKAKAGAAMAIAAQPKMDEFQFGLSLFTSAAGVSATEAVASKGGSGVSEGAAAAGGRGRAGMLH